MERIFADGVPGDLLEAGVWRGGLAILMSALLQAHGEAERRLWAADSFAGIPQFSDADDRGVNSWQWRYDVSLEEVKDHFVRFGLLSEQVRFVRGYFNESLAGWSAPLALIHADADAYRSTMDILQHLYPRLVVGGFVIIDDFHLTGARQARPPVVHVDLRADRRK